jgi:DNA recombination protein RmuC
VVLFIPGESFLEAAVRLSPDLLERAMNLNVVVATPTTLIALLKAVAMGWREQQVAENARHISDLGRELHSRIATALDHVDKLGKALDNSAKHYNALVGSIESSVLPQARRFKDLGADSPKELPVEGHVRRAERQPRQLQAAEHEPASHPEPEP